MEIHWRNARDITTEDRENATDRIERLAADHTDLIDVWLDFEKSAHHRKGVATVTIRCQARQAELVAHGSHQDGPMALRDALERFEREVQKMRQRRRQRRVERSAAPPIAGVVDQVLVDEDHGFVLTDSGERVYFHRNAVGGGLEFETLDEGQTVALNYEAGEKGLQATVVTRPPSA